MTFWLTAKVLDFCKIAERLTGGQVAAGSFDTSADAPIPPGWRDEAERFRCMPTSKKARHGRSRTGKREKVDCYWPMRYVRSPPSGLKDTTVYPASSSRRP
jgi:hypothetical protein